MPQIVVGWSRSLFPDQGSEVQLLSPTVFCSQVVLGAFRSLKFSGSISMVLRYNCVKNRAGLRGNTD